MPTAQPAIAPTSSMTRTRRCGTPGIYSTWRPTSMKTRRGKPCSTRTCSERRLLTVTFGRCQASLATSDHLEHRRSWRQPGCRTIPATWDELLTACDTIKIGRDPPHVLGSRRRASMARHARESRGRPRVNRGGQFDISADVEAFEPTSRYSSTTNGFRTTRSRLTWQQSVAHVVAEETAFYLNGAWTIGNEITGEGAAPDLKDHVEFAPYPSIGPNGSTVEIKQTTGIGLSAALARTIGETRRGAEILQVLVQRRGAKQWILLTRSPMGVNVDLSTIEGV